MYKHFGDKHHFIACGIRYSITEITFWSTRRHNQGSEFDTFWPKKTRDSAV